jgi:hypothetical protein
MSPETVYIFEKYDDLIEKKWREPGKSFTPILIHRPSLEFSLYRFIINFRH